MPLMVVKVKVLVCNYPFLLLQPLTGTFVRTCVATPAGMLYLREVVAKCQLNHLYGGSPPMGVPTCHKTNLVACYVRDC